MQVKPVHADAEAQEAAAIVRRCVHCGFCNATCPTYQLFGDELDGPRGRIYQIRQLLEGEAPTAHTRLHLDRCLTCRSCETTCPSGVEFARLLDYGRAQLEAQLPRSVAARASRALLLRVLTGAWFAPLLWSARLVRAWLPARAQALIPPLQRRLVSPAPRQHARKVVLLRGCVQGALSPDIHVATCRVLDALGIEPLVAASAGCCGAVRQHLGDADGARAEARRNVDAWWPLVEAGAEAIVMNASGCGTMVLGYGELLRDEPHYAARAARIAALCTDVSVLLARLQADLLALPRDAAPVRVAFHPPCTLQHGQQVRGLIEQLLAGLGANVLPLADAHLCCGSAGTYMLLQSAAARELRSRKLSALQHGAPEVILSANIGCITHLAGGTTIPVRHWVEWVAERLR